MDIIDVEETCLISYDFNFIRGVDGMVEDKIRFTVETEVYEVDVSMNRWQIKTDYSRKCPDRPFLCYKKDSAGVRFMIQDQKCTKIYTDIKNKKIVRL